MGCYRWAGAHSTRCFFGIRFRWLPLPLSLFQRGCCTHFFSLFCSVCIVVCLCVKPRIIYRTKIQTIFLSHHWFYSLLFIIFFLWTTPYSFLHSASLYIAGFIIYYAYFSAVDDANWFSARYSIARWNDKRRACVSTYRCGIFNDNFISRNTAISLTWIFTRECFLEGGKKITFQQHRAHTRWVHCDSCIKQDLPWSIIYLFKSGCWEQRQWSMHPHAIKQMNSRTNINTNKKNTQIKWSHSFSNVDGRVWHTLFTESRRQWQKLIQSFYILHWEHNWITVRAHTHTTHTHTSETNNNNNEKIKITNMNWTQTEFIYLQATGRCEWRAQNEEQQNNLRYAKIHWCGARCIAFRRILAGVSFCERI